MPDPDLEYGARVRKDKARKRYREYRLTVMGLAAVLECPESLRSTETITSRSEYVLRSSSVTGHTSRKGGRSKGRVCTPEGHEEHDGRLPLCGGILGPR